MNNVFLALDGAWRVLIASLVLGAGLPAMFALGVRALALEGQGAGTPDRSGTPGQPGRRSMPKPLARALALLCFAVVLAGVTLGITYIVASSFGKTLSFEHVFPTLVSK